MACCAGQLPHRGLLLCCTHQDVADAIGSQKAIIDASAQRVGVEGFPKVLVSLNRFAAQGSSGQPDLDGTLEVFQNGTPARIGLCAAAVTLVDDNDVEEVAGETVVEAGAFP